MKYQAKVTVDSNAYNILFGYTLTSYGGRYVNKEIDNSELISDGNGGYYFTVDIPINKCASVPVPGSIGTYETYGINVDCLCKIEGFQSGKNSGLKCIWYALPLCHHDMSYYTWDERATFEGNVKQDVQAFGVTNIGNEVENNVIIDPEDSAVCSKKVYGHDIIFETRSVGIIIKDDSAEPFQNLNTFNIDKISLDNNSIIYGEDSNEPEITFNVEGHYAYGSWTYNSISTKLKSNKKYKGWMRMSLTQNKIGLDESGDPPYTASYKVVEILHYIQPLKEVYPDTMDSDEPDQSYFVHNKAYITSNKKFSFYTNTQIDNVTGNDTNYILETPEKNKEYNVSGYFCTDGKSCSFNPKPTDYNALLATITKLPDDPLVYGINKDGNACIESIPYNGDSSNIIGPISGDPKQHYSIGQSGTVDPKSNDSERW